MNPEIQQTLLLDGKKVENSLKEKVNKIEKLTFARQSTSNY